MSKQSKLFHKMADILSDSVEILDVLIESREELIGEKCEVSRHLRTRVKAVLKTFARARGAT